MLVECLVQLSGNMDRQAAVSEEAAAHCAPGGPLSTSKLAISQELTFSPAAKLPLCSWSSSSIV